ncbi:RNA polymerase sigma factor [Sphingobacterium sp. MYb382]|uniref:RNA polymerase sigma factor n=1 Tax=Sphingobacterium sp. MYb382 TaxID=2745278 RepID=UPI0030A8AAAD
MHVKNIDKSILLAMSKGDIKAFEHIYKTYSMPLYRNLLYLLKDSDEVDEIIHNTFLKVWTKKEAIDLDKNFYSYLLKIANSMAIDFLRRNVRTQAVCENLLITGNKETPSVEEAYLKKEEWLMVEEGINMLPPQRKLIFTLFKLEGKSYQEISDELSISKSTVSGQIVIAMKFLRKFMATHQKELKTLFFFLWVR